MASLMITGAKIGAIIGALFRTGSVPKRQPGSKEP
jgi:hypothetical protein